MTYENYYSILFVKTPRLKIDIYFFYQKDFKDYKINESREFVSYFNNEEFPCEYSFYTKYVEHLYCTGDYCLIMIHQI